jgi:predicted NBD/HSP70 family sugar kinase
MPDNSQTSANFAGVEIAGTTMRAVTVSSDGTVVAQRERNPDRSSQSASPKDSD